MAEPKSLNDALMLVCAYRECAVDVIEPALADPRIHQALVARTRAQAATERELASAAKVRSEEKSFFGPDMRAVDAHTAVWRAENAGLLDLAADIIENDASQPTWRDVIRAMRAEGVRLRPLYDIAESPADRTWRVLSPNGTELGCVTHETGYWGEEWSVAFTYECGPSARMGAEALKPADVLALARISGLTGGAS